MTCFGQRRRARCRGRCSGDHGNAMRGHRPAGANAMYQRVQPLVGWRRCTSFWPTENTCAVPVLPAMR